MNILGEEREESLKIKRSEFIAHLCTVSSMEEAKEYITQVSKEHRNANHNCWAYVVGEKGEHFHSSDNGEPSGSAGKPILSMLQKHDLTNVVAVVTRYFGGVKLGIRGLIDAYSEVTEVAILQSPIEKLCKTQSYEITVSYAQAETFKYKIQQMGVMVGHIDYTDQVTIDITAEENLFLSLESQLENWQNQGSIQYVKKEPATK